MILGEIDHDSFHDVEEGGAPRVEHIAEMQQVEEQVDAGEPQDNPKLEDSLETLKDAHWVLLVMLLNSMVYGPIHRGWKIMKYLQ